MSTVPLAERVLQALPLPPSSRLDQRVPKTVLADSGRFTAAQKRALHNDLEQLWWVAVLKPDSAGLRAHDGPERPVHEVQVLRVVPRGPRGPPGPPGSHKGALALLPALHRSIEHATFIVVDDGSTDGAGVALSLARKRRAVGNAAGVVVEDVLTVPLDGGAVWLDAALDALAAPAADLRSLLSGWRRCLVALARAAAVGAFIVPADNAGAAFVEGDLALRRVLLQEQKKQTLALRRERQTARRVALNLALQERAAALTACQLRLEGKTA